MQKCAILVMKRGKVVDTKDMIMPNGDEIRAMGKDSEYRYMGVLECDTVKNAKVKALVTEEYKHRLVKMLKSKLNSGNLMRAINTYAVAVVRYTAGILKWTKEEMNNMDRMTRKKLTMYGGLHPKSDVDRLYVKRCHGGRGLASIYDVVEHEESQLTQYMMNSPDAVMEAVRNRINIRESNEQSVDRYTKWKEKTMHGQFLRQTEDKRSDETWLWLKRGTLKRETESLITAAQEQALRTNYRRARIEKDESSPKCRLCKVADETVSHIVSECKKLAQLEYKARHDRVATAFHWNLAKKYGFPHCDQWYQHVAEPVLENENTKLLWDFNIYTDHVIEARRPDIVVVRKDVSECLVVDIAVPGDVRVEEKEEEKLRNTEIFAES